MKNLNKILALVIVLAMAFSTVAFAGTFSDVADTDSYAEAVEVLAALGLLNGYEDGTFGPAKTITRAEFAAVIIRTLGLEDAATGAFGVSFDDVPANEWYAGYVMMAAQQGIVNGYGDGTFKPSKDVKFEEAVKMIVCALGFQKKFENVADAYPTAYVAQAHTLGLTMGANQAIGTDASRGVVAKLVYNSLDVGKMAQVEYGTDQQWAQTNVTILSENLNVAKVEGTVSSVSFANEGAKKLTYNYSKIAMQFDPSYTTYSFPNPKLNKTTIEYADTVAPLKHYKTVAYIDMADESNPVMVALVEKPGANESMTITATQAKNAVYDSTNNKITYFKNSWDEDSEATEVKLAGSHTIYSNNNATAIAKNSFNTPYAAGKYPVITLINNDGIAGYDVIYATDYFAGVVDEINDRINRITFDGITTGGAAAITLNPTAEDVTFDIYDEEGNAIEFADIKEGDVINAFKSQDSENNTYYEVYVTSTKLEGTVSENNGNGYYDIDGEEHYSEVSLTAGDKGIFYVDMFGKVLKFELSDDSNRNFAVLYAAYVDNNGLDAEPKAVLYTANGEFVEYGFAKNINMNGSSTVKYTTVSKDTLTTTSGTPAVTTINTTVLPTAQKIVMYTVNAAGQINEIYWGAGINYRDENFAAKGTGSGVYRDTTSKLGGNVMPEGVSIVTLSDATYQSTLKRENFATADLSVLVDDETTYDYDIIEDKRNDDVEFAVIFNLKAKVAADSDVMFVTNVSDATDSEGASAKRFTGYVNGLKTSIVVPTDVVMYNASNVEITTGASTVLNAIAKGAMIQFNGNEEATAVRVIASVADVIDWADSTTNHGSRLSYSATGAGTAGEDNDKIGNLYVGKVAEYKGGAAEFAGTSPVVDLSVSSSAPTMLVRFAQDSATNTIIGNTYVNDYIVFGVAETNNFVYDDAAASSSTNGDYVVVYSFDGEALATMILDVDGDDKWN